MLSGYFFFFVAFVVKMFNREAVLLSWSLLYQRTILFLSGILTSWSSLPFLPFFCMIFVILCSYIYPCLHLSIHHQSLESALRHPGDNRTQIRELGQTLIDGGILDELISEKLKAFNSRYEQLNHQVRTLSLCVSKCGMHVFVTIEKGIRHVLNLDFFFCWWRPVTPL